MPYIYYDRLGLGADHPYNNVCPGSTLQLASHLVAMPYLWNVEEGEKNVFVYVKRSSGTSAQHFRV